MLTIKQLQTAVFGPVSLSLNAGDALVVTGSSGSGKTRFLRALADLDPAQGEVWLEGRERFSMPAFEWRSLVRYVPAVSAWWHPIVRSHFQTACLLEPWMERLSLPLRLLDSPVEDLSTGEKQRLAFLRAMQGGPHEAPEAGVPKVFLLDEPTSALDEAAIGLVEAMMDELLAQGALLMIVSHRPAQIAKYGAKQLRFDEGRSQVINGALA